MRLRSDHQVMQTGIPTLSCAATMAYGTWLRYAAAKISASAPSECARTATRTCSGSGLELGTLSLFRLGLGLGIGRLGLRLGLGLGLGLGLRTGVQ